MRRDAHSYWVYILTSRTRVLYVGVTNDLGRRVAQHRAGEGSAFVKQYKVRRLVHCEEHPSIKDAIQREKQLKGWTRAKKQALIEEDNSDWTDLAPDWR